LVIVILTLVVHLISTLAYSVRVAGVRTRRLLTAFSLYNIIYLLASVSNTIQAPLLTSVMEHGIKAVLMDAGITGSAEQLIYHEAYREQLSLLAGQIRLVIVASTFGTLLGAALIPVFIRIFIRAIRLFEEKGSVAGAFLKLAASFLQRGERPVRRHSLLSFTSIRKLAGKKLSIPINFLLANIVVTGLYTTGVLSALYAGAMFPDFRSTAAMLAAMVNGIATVLGAVVVEPAAASITDEALRGDRDETDVKQMAFYMALTRLAGTILAQALFLPGAYFIKFLAQLLA